MPNDRLRITIPQELIQQLIARRPLDTQQHSTIISRDLDRYYFLLDRARIRLRELFDTAETGAICEACRQYQPQQGAWEPWNIPLLHTQVLEAIELHDLDQRWTVDGRELVTKLRSLDHLALFALVDAVERFWTQPTSVSDPDGTVTLNFSKVFADPVAATHQQPGKRTEPLSTLLDAIHRYDDEL
jgi:hypothetical protein